VNVEQLRRYLDAFDHGYMTESEIEIGLLEHILGQPVGILDVCCEPGYEATRAERNRVGELNARILDPIRRGYPEQALAEVSAGVPPGVTPP
jgi:hypothetical protein